MAKSGGRQTKAGAGAKAVAASVTTPISSLSASKQRQLVLGAMGWEGDYAYDKSILTRNGDGLFTARDEFFYTHGKTAQDFADRITSRIQAVTPYRVNIVHAYENRKPFRGGANTRANSHWEVQFQLTD